MTKKTWLITLAFGLPWTFIMLIFYSLFFSGLTINIMVTTLIAGSIAGLLFALAIQFTAKMLFRKIVVEIEEHEQVIKEAGANHFKGKEGVGGKLVLTNKRLIFKSHRFNIQNHQDSFGLDVIEKIQTHKTLNIFENGLTIQLANQDSHRFTVDEPRDWVEVITNQKPSRIW